MSMDLEALAAANAADDIDQYMLGMKATTIKEVCGMPSPSS